MTLEAPLRVALHTGALFRHDAISKSLLAKLDAFEDARREGAPIEARALVSFSEVTRPEVCITPGAFGVVHHPWFQCADVHIYEFGIWYEAFDTIFVVSPRAATIATYHNVTPPELAGDEKSRALLSRSCGKKANLERFDEVACASVFSRDELVAAGMDPDRLSVVPLPPAVPLDAGRRRPRSRGAPIELLYVGRFVAAKGVLDLMDAMRKARAVRGSPFRLLLAGNEHLSDPDVVAELRVMAMSSELRGTVEIRTGIEDDELGDLYLEADVLVIPSYHEGYCMPVVEALAAGAHVITTNAGNLPNIVAGVGKTVPVGDVAALATAIVDLVNRLAASAEGAPLEVPTDDGPIDDATWRARVEEHRKRHSVEAFRSGLWRAVSRALAAKGEPQPAWLLAKI